MSGQSIPIEQYLFDKAKYWQPLPLI